MRVQVHSSLVGPTATNDIFYANLHGTPRGATNFFVEAYDFARGGHTATMTLGVNLTDIVSTLALWDHDLAPGAACEIEGTLFNHALAVLDGPATLGGFVWDPTSGVYVLVANAQAGQIASILAAVTKQLPSLP